MSKFKYAIFSSTYIYITPFLLKRSTVYLPFPVVPELCGSVLTPSSFSCPSFTVPNACDFCSVFNTYSSDARSEPSFKQSWIHSYLRAFCKNIFRQRYCLESPSIRIVKENFTLYYLRLKTTIPYSQISR